jgi:hypothetical protein
VADKPNEQGHAVVPIVRHGDENTPPPPTTKKGKRREV